MLAAYVACFIVVVLGHKVRFDNYRVYSAVVKNETQLKVLRDLEIRPDGILFLKTPTTASPVADFIVPPHKFADIAELFEAFDIKNHLKTENLQKLVKINTIMFRAVA